MSDRWEVALTLSEKGFQQVSFVNSVATTKVCIYLFIINWTFQSSCIADECFAAVRYCIFSIPLQNHATFAIMSLFVVCLSSYGLQLDQRSMPWNITFVICHLSPILIRVCVWYDKIAEPRIVQFYREVAQIFLSF